MLKNKLLLVTLLMSLSAFGQVECELPLIPATMLKGTRNMSQTSELKIASYNVLNLEHSVGKYKVDKETGVKTFFPDVITKDPADVKAVAEIIIKQDLDIIVLQEVEGIQALKMFNERYLNNQFEHIVLPGNDGRGIEIGFLIKKDLPIKYKIKSNRDAKHTYSVSGEEIKVFSRDLPAVHIWKQNSLIFDDPEMIIMGNHLKSQRDRKGDPKSIIMRTAQVEEMTEIVNHYKKVFPESPVFVAGDFNANLITGPEFKPIKNSSDLKDSFDLNKTTMSDMDRVTHSFHPKGGETSYSQMDGIFLNPKAQSYFKESRVYRYKQDGVEKPLPKTYAERETNPSDHYPVIITVNSSILN